MKLAFDRLDNLRNALVGVLSVGRPATPPRLVAGLLYLQHTFACSDEELIRSWVENPYWRLFCGETYFQHEPPIDPSSLTRLATYGKKGWSGC